MVTIFWEFEHKICYSSAFTIDYIQDLCIKQGVFGVGPSNCVIWISLYDQPLGNGNEIWIGLMDDAQLRTDQKYRKAVSK